jgi:hypothetical protein
LKAPSFPAFWIVLCVFLNCAGWVLSAAHQLNAFGYAVVLLLGGAAAMWSWKGGALGNFQRFRFRPHRFKRAFPLAFLVLAALALLGGVLYAPSDFDALAYRTPRILQWLAVGHWRWIHTDFHRLNTRGCGFEWLATPLIVFTKTDRLLFVINAVLFLLLPGLVFGVFTRLGVRRRVAWHWMWLLPSAYCFVLQAGGIGNDLIGAVFVLASIDLALRARAGGDHRCLWLSLLAAALATSSKASNLPLLLPWFLAAWPALRVLKRRIFSTAAVCAVAALSSFLPSAALNVRYCGDWTGLAAERAMFNRNHPLAGILMHGIILTVENLVPPVCPHAHSVSDASYQLVPASIRARLRGNFEGDGHFVLGEMQTEEDAGLGVGICVMLLIGLPAAFSGWKSTFQQRGRAPVFWQKCILVSGYVSLLAYASKSGLTAAARLITSYYAPMVPSLLLGESHARLVKKTWWKRAAMVVAVLAGIMVAIQPARPLFPARPIFAKLKRARPSSALVARAELVYSVYAERPYAFALALARLPADLDVLGLVTFDDPETSLWRPFGRRRVEHVTSADTPESLRQRGVRYILVSPEHFEVRMGKPFDHWLVAMHAEVLEKIPLTLRAAEGTVEWPLVRLLPAGANNS